MDYALTAVPLAAFDCEKLTKTLFIMFSVFSTSLYFSQVRLDLKRAKADEDRGWRLWPDAKYRSGVHVFVLCCCMMCRGQ